MSIVCLTVRAAAYIMPHMKQGRFPKGSVPLSFSEKNFILIRFENYYEGEIRFKDGLPVTTKEAGSVHGYGLKSLRYTVKKYGGEMQISAEDNWFSLRILIPVDMKDRKQ